jgi:beta-lactam-binding protein with PASTA domain
MEFFVLLLFFATLVNSAMIFFALKKKPQKRMNKPSVPSVPTQKAKAYVKTSKRKPKFHEEEELFYKEQEEIKTRGPFI